MKTTSIPAQSRADQSKAATKALRKDGKVPAVLYGASGSNSILLDYADAKTVLFTAETYIVNLDVDGTTRDTIVREAQYHPVTDKIMHIDFLELTPGKVVEVVLPIKINGTPKGVIKGGRLMQKMRKLKVKGIPTDLPEFIEVPVGHLDLGQSIKVSELETELQITSGASSAIASVEIPRALRSAAASAGGDDAEE